MNISEQCLSCLVGQAVKTANYTNAENKEELYKKIFHKMSDLDFNKTSPEVFGECYEIIKAHVGSDDPYKSIKTFYNKMFLDRLEEYDSKIKNLEEAIIYSIVANIIDFNPVHVNVEEDIKYFFSNVYAHEFSVNHISSLVKDIKKAKSILYIGDNCGEICFDMLLIKRIKEVNPSCKIFFGVRGAAVVNDNNEEDAYFVGMDKYATIISSGDNTQGTILTRTSKEFNQIFEQADLVISKGQANYETLNEEKKHIYFLLMVKCSAIAGYIGAKERTLVCLNNNNW